ncbi:hypothetical protein [Raineyella sp.]|uniref:hypothetical protein n=1 Tax=Raineyella sp. TaxID=1911550 RepID=UPI002B1F30E0|nr:hypothetical protein [Raineyella sp.]MEA5155496.1 hypothetical protein [Raineyella sp.]
MASTAGRLLVVSVAGIRPVAPTAGVRPVVSYVRPDGGDAGDAAALGGRHISCSAVMAGVMPVSVKDWGRSFGGVAGDWARRDGRAVGVGVVGVVAAGGGVAGFAPVGVVVAGGVAGGGVAGVAVRHGLAARAGPTGLVGLVGNPGALWAGVRPVVHGEGSPDGPDAPEAGWAGAALRCGCGPDPRVGPVGLVGLSGRSGPGLR